MSIYDATFAVIEALDQGAVPYMLSGSLASMYYSFPRSTTDADFVVDFDTVSLGELSDLLGSGFRVDPQSGFELIGGTRRNVIEIVGTPFKIELFRLSEEPFDQERFKRRVQVELAGRMVNLPTPEDVIVQKLIWQRPKDREDLIGVMAVNWNSLDKTYLHKWCDDLGHRELFDELWRESQKIASDDDRGQ